MQDMLIYGCGGVGRLTAQIVDDINRGGRAWNLLGFLDDDPATHDTRVAGVRVLGGGEQLAARPEVWIALGCAAPRVKAELVARLAARGATRFATLVHPTAWVGARTELGAGCLVYPGAAIDPDVRLEDFGHVNKLVSIGHDTVVGRFATLAPGVHLGGANRIGEGVTFGINSATVQGVEVGAWSVVGGGALVRAAVPPGRVVVGVPARDLKAAPS